VSFNIHVTVNYPDGTENVIECNPKNLYNLKKIVGDLASDMKEASSFVFVVVPLKGEQSEGKSNNES
jgi:hypothetical protein